MSHMLILQKFNPLTLTISFLPLKILHYLNYYEITLNIILLYFLYYIC